MTNNTAEMSNASIEHNFTAVASSYIMLTFLIEYCSKLGRKSNNKVTRAIKKGLELENFICYLIRISFSMYDGAFSMLVHLRVKN